MRHSFILLSIFISSICSSQIVETWRDVPDFVSSSALLGLNLETEGDWLVVSTEAQRIFIYHRVNEEWVEWQEITGSSGASDEFGVRLDFDGQRIAVTDYGYISNDIQSGRVSVYELDGDDWELLQHIESLQPNVFSGFSSDVAILGNRLAVGAKNDTSLTGGGEVYLYELESEVWSLTDTISPDIGVAGSEFGDNILLMEQDVFIQALKDGGSGAVYHFREGEQGWEQRQKIEIPDAWTGVNPGFGFRIAAQGEQLFISARDLNWSNGEVQMGKVYEYIWNGAEYTQGQTFEPTADIGTNCRFGSGLDFNGEALLIGSPNEENCFGELAGKVYKYEHNGSEWELVDFLCQSEGAFGDLFGLGIAITEEEEVFISAVGDDEVSQSQGELYYFNDLINSATEHDGWPSDLQLYPNPATDHLMLNGAERLQGGWYEIIGISGRTHAQGRLIDSTQTELSVSGLSAGLYLLRLYTSNGASYQRRFVKG